MMHEFKRRRRHKKWLYRKSIMCECGGLPKAEHTGIPYEEYYRYYCDKCGKSTKWRYCYGGPPSPGQTEWMDIKGIKK